MKNYLEFIKEDNNDVIVYHGGSAKLTNDNINDVVFTTPNKEDALWYSYNRGGWLTKMIITIKNPLECNNKSDFKNKWIPILNDADINYDFKELPNDSWEFYSIDIQKYSPYEGENFYDLVYIPKFVESAKKFRYDGIKGYDVLSNEAIPIYITFSKESINVISSEVVN
jgi:hypothetical protein